MGETLPLPTFKNMNYTNLQARISKRFQDRSDLATVIQNAINDIRLEICGGEISTMSGRLYQHRWSFCFQATTQATTKGTHNYANPTGCIEVLGIANGDKRLEKKDWDFYSKYYMGSASQGGPNAWIPRNEEYWIMPIPDAVYTLNLDYYGMLADLSAGIDEGSLDKHYPMLVMDGASMLVAEYLNQDNFYQIYGSRFEKKLLNAISSDKGIEVRKVRSRFHPSDDINDDEYLC